MGIISLRKRFRSKSGNTQRWIVFVACCVRLFFTSGSLKANGVILDELVVKLNSNHVFVAWAFSLQNGLYYLLTPLTHKLMDFFSHRQLSIVGGFLVGSGYVLSGLYANKTWHIFATYALSGVGFGLQTITSYLCLKEHFPHTFSEISSTTTLFHFVGMASLPSILNMFKTEYGLESSLLLLGAIMWNLVPCGVGTKAPEKTESELSTQNNGKLLKAGEVDEIQEYNLNEDSDKTDTLIFLEKWFPFLLPFYHHGNFRYVIIFSITGMYVYTSWVIFLVSLGTSLDLPNDQAVFLSAVGGVGGFLGRSLCIALFYFNKVNAQVCCFPFLLTAISMMLVIFMKRYFMIVSLTFISGFSQGISTTALYGLLPLMLCNHHFPSGVSTLMMMEGLVLQLSGLISGALHDAMGSTRYVFAFNALLCVAVLPLMIPWTCSEQTVKKCKSR